MSTKRARLDYDPFMVWFSEKYPELFKLHQGSIIFPLDGEGVTVNKKDMDAQTYKLVVAATQEYYRDEQIIKGRM